MDAHYDHEAFLFGGAVWVSILRSTPTYYPVAPTHNFLLPNVSSSDVWALCGDMTNATYLSLLLGSQEHPTQEEQPEGVQT